MWLLSWTSIGNDGAEITHNVRSPVYLPGVPSMSRKHAVIRCPTSDTITVTDMSTSVIAGGVFVNGVRMDKGATLKIADGDTATWMDIVACLSRIDMASSGPSGAIGKAASALGAELTRELTPKCSHLVVKSEPAVITAKFACALILGIEVVLDSWLTAMADPTVPGLPSCDMYRPVKADGQLVCSAERFKQSAPNVFAGKVFCFFSMQQLETFKEVIGTGGGRCSVIRWRGRNNEVLPSDVVVEELVRLLEVERPRSLVLISPRGDRLALTASIRAAFEQRGAFCNEEALISSAVVTRSCDALRFVDLRSVSAVSPRRTGPSRGDTSVASPLPVHAPSSAFKRAASTALPVAPIHSPSKKPRYYAQSTANASTSELPVHAPSSTFKRSASTALPVAPSGSPAKKPRSVPPPTANATTPEPPAAVPLETVPDRKDRKPLVTLFQRNLSSGEGSSADNAIVVGFDVPERTLPVERPVPQTNGVNYKVFRKANFEKHYKRVSMVKPMVAVSEDVEVGLPKSDVRDLQNAQDREDREEEELDGLFASVGIGGNVSRQRRATPRRYNV
ncbi:hypothetical protein PBRA_001533 [Plasmodiophora brassicae]|uniref:FHA domain-containing protein n=1 Tax=Plasmodiophora brassicae TaxID=37360 RepID=A0A0G4IZB4_PLABS|nr:hypothetical protein PBRA_001533 [Plasmodiophora brassicae]